MVKNKNPNSHHFESFILRFIYHWEGNYQLSRETTQSRWGIVSVSATFFSFLIAFAIALLSIWLVLFHDFAVEETLIMDISKYIMFAITILIAIVGVIGLVFVWRLGIYWIKHPYESNTDLKQNGIHNKKRTKTKR